MLLICSKSANCNVIHKVEADHKKRGCSRSRLRGDRGQLFHRRITIHTSQLSHHSQRGVTINASHSAPITASNIAHQTSQQLPRLTSEVAAASKQQLQGCWTIIQGQCIALNMGLSRQGPRLTWKASWVGNLTIACTTFIQDLHVLNLKPLPAAWNPDNNARPTF